MAEIINIIRHPHLVTYKAYDSSAYRCCAVCEYKVFIEKDDGEIIIASVLDDDNLKDFDIEETVQKMADEKQNEDLFYAYNLPIGKEDIENFVKGHIEEGYGAVETFCDVLRSLRESNSIIHNNGMEALKMLKDELDKTIDTLRD